ncbi:CsgG/HfaB family protein [uncultured Shewanella sp.]|uniref:CsgG/HfaB family protein n=1 Tax=uncultured Shewanella sp. TaxID=173975 RepID=UPI0037045F71
MGGTSTLKNAADYLIVGSITEFGCKEVSDVGVFSRVKKQEANAKVNIRIVMFRQAKSSIQKKVKVSPIQKQAQ